MRILLLFLLLSAGDLTARDSSSPAALQRNTLHGTTASRAEAYQQLITLQQVHDPDRAYRSIQSLLDLSRKAGYNRGLMYAWYQLGVYHNMKGRYDSLKYYGDRCLDPAISRELPESKAFGHHLTGTYFWQTGRFDKASASHYQALRIRQKLKDLPGTAASLASLAGVFTSTGKLDKAQAYISKALAIARKIPDERLILRCLHAQANIHGMSGKYDLALKSDREALNILEKTGNLRGYSEIYSNMALCYFYMGDLDRSIAYHQKVLKIDRYFGDKKQIGDTYLNLAQAYRKKGDHDRAASLLKDAVTLFTATSYRYGLKDAHLSLSKIYEDRKDYRQAFLEFRRYHDVAEKLSNEANNKTIEQLHVEYDTEQREQKIRSLNQQATIQALEIKERNLLLIILFTLTGAGAVLIVLLYRQRKFREAARLEQEINRQRQLAARAVMEAEEKERHRIANELHDGVGQLLSGALMNLNLLHQKAELLGQEVALTANTLALISEGYDELRAVSHQMVPDSLLKRGLVAAVEDLLNKIDSGRLKTRLETIETDLRCSPEIQTAIYRMIQETLTNVLKHASATRFSVQLFREEEGIFLSMEDDGIGFDTAAEFQGMGLRNLRNRIDCLNGTLELNSRPGNGTFITIFLPVPERVTPETEPV